MKAFLVILLISVSCFAQDAVKQLSDANLQLEQRLATLKVSDDLKKQCTNDIADARANLKRGNLFLSLYTIRTCQLELSSLAYATSKTDISKKGTEAFEEEWRQLGSALTEKERTISDRTTKLPAVVVAIADISQSQVRPFYQSARLSALNSNMEEGIYYLGRAPANLNFAIFCRALHLARPKKSTTEFRSPQPELTKLETAALRTYKSTDISSQQGQYNRLNSNLKIATELNRAAMFEGALLKYLESTLDFGLIITTAENEDVQHLRARTRELGKLLQSEKLDHSIGLLFWQMAEMNLNPQGTTEPTPAQIKRAVVILNNVIPAYFDYLKERLSGKI